MEDKTYYDTSINKWNLHICRDCTRPKEENYENI